MSPDNSLSNGLWYGGASGGPEQPAQSGAVRGAVSWTPGPVLPSVHQAGSQDPADSLPLSASPSTLLGGYPCLSFHLWPLRAPSAFPLGRTPGFHEVRCLVPTCTALRHSVQPHCRRLPPPAPSRYHTTVWPQLPGFSLLGCHLGCCSPGSCGKAQRGAALLQLRAGAWASAPLQGWGSLRPPLFCCSNCLAGFFPLSFLSLSNGLKSEAVPAPFGGEWQTSG